MVGHFSHKYSTLLTQNLWNNKIITPMVNHHFLSPLALNITIFIIRDSEKLSKLLRETVRILKARNTVQSTEKNSNIPQTDKRHRTSWWKLSPDISQANFIFRLLYVYMWNRCDFHLSQSGMLFLTTKKTLALKGVMFLTLREKARVGCFKRTASKHVYYLGWNRSPAQVGCMRQALRPGALGRPRGIGWRGRWEGGSGWGPHVNPWLFHFIVWQNPLQ